MKIEILTGSPRRSGNTSIMAGWLKKELEERDAEVSIIRLYDHHIKPCNDCRGCKKGALTCVLNDDMPALYKKLDASDVIIIGTPIYWYGPTAMTKLFIDRMRPYYANHRLEGKKGAIFLVAGDGKKDTGLTVSMLKKTFETLGVRYLGSVNAKAYDEGEVLHNKQALRSLKRLADLIG